MIDKLDLRIPYTALLRREFRFVNDELRFSRFGSRIEPSRHYQGVVNLRKGMGIDAILHVNFKHRGKQNHKLELIETERKSLRELAEIITRVFEVDPASLSIMRVDLTADLPGIAVTDLFRSLRVRHKRTADAEGELDFQDVAGKRLEYFRYGRSPNCIRVYDKSAECRARYKRDLKKVSRDAETPSFEEFYGFPPDAIMTRIERQCGGGRIPRQVATFGQLSEAADFNPFTNVEVCAPDFVLPDPSRMDPRTAVKLAGIHEYVKAYGKQVAYGVLNAGRNAKRFFNTYEEYLEAGSAARLLTVDSMVESYRRSTQAQIDGSIKKCA